MAYTEGRVAGRTYVQTWHVDVESRILRTQSQDALLVTRLSAESLPDDGTDLSAAEFSDLVLAAAVSSSEFDSNSDLVVTLYTPDRRYLMQTRRVARSHRLVTISQGRLVQ
jgi:hypothetical protein